MSDAFFPLVAPAPSAPVAPIESSPPVGSGLTDDGGAPLGKIEDVGAHMLERLLSKYRGKPRLEGSLRAVGAVLQPLEDALWALFTARGLDNAEGVQLDGLGEIVDEPRKGRIDDVYRRFIGVRILVNRSNGRIEELNTILTRMLGEGASFFVRQYAMSLVVHVNVDIAPLSSTEILTYLRKAKAGGVRLAMNQGDGESALLFGSAFDEDLTDMDHGLSSDDGSILGGNLSSYQVA